MTIKSYVFTLLSRFEFDTGMFHNCFEYIVLILEKKLALPYGCRKK